MAGIPKLIVLSEQLRGKSFELIDDEYAIGRSEDCEISIPDPAMSGRHCVLSREADGGYVLQDNDSTNGTRVNGVKVHSQRLTNSDIVQVGGLEMLYDSEEKSAISMLSTQTGINLEEGAGELPISQMTNFSPYSTQSALQDKRWVIWGLRGGIGVLVLAVIIMLANVLLKLVGG